MTDNHREMTDQLFELREDVRHIRIDLLAVRAKISATNIFLGAIFGLMVGEFLIRIAS